MTGAPFDLRPAIDRALIYTPYRRDAEYITSLLSGHGIACGSCLTEEELRVELTTPPGILVITHEAITRKAMDDIAAHLHSQPAWSELPIFILLDRNSPKNRLRQDLQVRWLRSRQIYYERPVTSIELLSGIQSALLARLRQSDLGEFLNREVELRRELNHRVKNILASVISIFEMSMRGSGSKEALAENYKGRLRSLANVHSAVFHADGDQVSMAEVAQLIADPYRAANSAQIFVDGPDVLLSRECATTFALCLHELATNAAKYGALSNSAGLVEFTWDVTHDAEPELTFRWRETGGPPVLPPGATGYGTRYIRTALSSLLGRKPVITFDGNGLICEGKGPLSRCQASAGSKAYQARSRESENSVC